MNQFETDVALKDGSLDHICPVSAMDERLIEKVYLWVMPATVGRKHFCRCWLARKNVS